MQTQSLRQEDPLDEVTATHSSVLVWRIPRTEEPGGLLSGGHTESDKTEVTYPAWPGEQSRVLSPNSTREEPRLLRSRTGRTLSPPQTISSKEHLNVK